MKDPTAKVEYLGGAIVRERKDPLEGKIPTIKMVAYR